MTAWTDERAAELTRRWEAGETAGVIAPAIGMTRNLVIAKAYRLGLEYKPSRPTLDSETNKDRTGKEGREI